MNFHISKLQIYINIFRSSQSNTSYNNQNVTNTSILDNIESLEPADCRSLYIYISICVHLCQLPYTFQCIFLYLKKNPQNSYLVATGQLLSRHSKCDIMLPQCLPNLKSQMERQQNTTDFEFFCNAFRFDCG